MRKKSGRWLILCTLALVVPLFAYKTLNMNDTFICASKVLSKTDSVMATNNEESYMGKTSLIKTENRPGDINADGIVNMKDYALFQQYLSGWEVEIHMAAADVNVDNTINMKDISLLQQYLCGWDVELKYNTDYGTSKEEPDVNYTKQIYGQSVLGRDLEYYCFEPQNYTETILLNFAIHGYEDEYDADGQVLVDTAHDLIDYYNENFEDLDNVRLIVIPCANPDGLYDGTTNNGFGRCNADGIDLNRDFDANYRTYSNARNYTPYAFSGVESRALRDLVDEVEPDVVIDFHGWLDYTIGDYELAQVFYDEMGLAHHTSFGTTNASGYFSNWAHQQGALGLLVEFTNSSSINMDELINVINRILVKDYIYSEEDLIYQKFDQIKCYALDKERISTYQYFDVPYSTASYIDGETDEVVILDVYENGWSKVQYPVSSGYKVAYAPISAFFELDETMKELQEYNVLTNTTVYQRDDLLTTYGVVYPTDECYVITDNGSTAQIIYELDAGGWKVGWIENK